MKASIYIATSLDGFIARENGDLDWLPGAEGDVSVEEYGYKDFIDTVDVLVIGRHTYEKVLSFGGWPYGKKSVVVLSSQPVKIPKKVAGTVEWMSGSPGEVIARLTERGATHAYVDGGKTIQRFLEAGLIQQIIITTIPVLLGGGIPLFGPSSHDIKLRHIETQQFPSGLVQSKYEVIG